MWFVCAQTFLVATVGVCWIVLGPEPKNVHTQKSRGTYLNLKIFGGVKDKNEEPLTAFNGKGGKSIPEVVRGVADTWGVHEEAVKLSRA